MTYEIIIDSEQVHSAKMIRAFTMRGFESVAEDVTFPFRTRINPQKNATFTFSVPGYNDYTLVIPSETTQSNFKLTFTENPKEMAKLNRYRDPTIPVGEANNMVTRDAPGQTALERTIIRWHIDSDPRGARIFYRIISSIPEIVKNTNETYMMTTPFEETRPFNILGLTYENARDVQIEFKVTKMGYEDQIKRFNVRQAIDQQEISSFFELVPKAQ